MTDLQRPDDRREPGDAHDAIDHLAADAAAVHAPGRGLLHLGPTTGGIAAIGVKELRGRMRGKRAFAILTIYLLLLGGFALMIETLIRQSYTSGFGTSAAMASAAIGQGLFAALLLLMTLQVAFLAPSSTAGAISLEREKQTLDLLIATPISSLAIILGKLLSTLVYLFLLIAASIPLMAVVFVYGGVAPEVVISGYAVLLASALGLGSFGILCSSLVKRTTAATAITIFGVLAITIGTIFILGFWAVMVRLDDQGNRVNGPLGIRSPSVLGYVNPFIAQADVLCETETGFGGFWCSAVTGLVPTERGIVFIDRGGVIDGNPGPAPIMEPGVAIDVPAAPPMRGEGRAVAAEGGGTGDVVVDPAQPLAQGRDALWPKSIATWLILSVLFIFLSIQLVSPTRRWRLRRGSRAPSSSTSAPGGSAT
jgi:ABC-type transport system involved in multi-copper enzyme maturation permease subunit